MIVNRFGNSGVFIYSKGGNKIINCYIGTNASGTAALPNKAHGIFCQTDNNTIGGTTTAERNLISGNAKAGVFFYLNSAHHNKVLGNYMGTDVTGTKAIANQNGVHVNAGQYNTIGGTTAGARNVLSGNIHDGVLINSGNAKGNVIQGNYMGTNAAGTAKLGNGWYGVEISQPENVVGGTAVGARNVISANGYAGVVMYLLTGHNNRVEGNYIGTDYTGTKDLGNVGAGVDMTNGAKNNIVGGTTTAARNIISGNDRIGVGIYNGSNGNQVLGNYIGICANGCALLNAKNGVLINNGSSGNVVKSNRIAWIGGHYAAVQISSGATSQSSSNTLYSTLTNGLKLV
jgi:titin